MRTIKIVLLFMLFFQFTIQSQVKNGQNNPDNYIPSTVILSNMNDSVNYTLGLTNGFGIKESYLKTDTSTKPIKLFLYSLERSYINEYNNNIYNLGESIGYSFRNFKYNGLLEEPTLKFDYNFIKKGIVDYFNNNFSIMTMQKALNLIENKSTYLKRDNISIQNINYAYGMTIGNSVKDYYKLKELSTKKGVQDLIDGINFSINNIYDKKYEELIKTGSTIGNELQEQKKTNLMKDQSLFVNFKIIRQGLINGMKGSNILMTNEEAKKYLTQTLDSLQKIQLEKEFGVFRKENEDFLANNKKKPGVITTSSGLQYMIIDKGYGQLPNDSSKVKVHYHGTLIDGTVFDSSVERGEPAVFVVNQVIKGWWEALKLMPVGSEYKLFIPQKLAFGSQETGKIKPFSTLIFEVKLIDIKD